MLASLLACAGCHAHLPASDIDRAREAFREAVAATVGVARSSIVVQPAYANLPDNPFDALQTGPFFALRADIDGERFGHRGFATADGRSVFARDSSAMGELLTAAGVGSATEPSIEMLVARARWIYPTALGARLIDDHPLVAEVTPPGMHFDAASQQFRLWYYTEEARETGLVLTFRNELSGTFGETFSFETRRAQ